MKLTPKVSFSTKFTDFLLLTGLLITAMTLLAQFILVFVTHRPIPLDAPNPHNLWTPHTVWADVWAMLSTFTIQSNILVLIFFCCALINHVDNNSAVFVKGRFSLAIAIYISITCVIFWVVLFPAMLKASDFSKSGAIINLIITIFLHLIVPLIMICYFFVTCGHDYWKYKKQAYLWTPLFSLYLFGYLAYILIKGNFVGAYRGVYNSEIPDYKEITYSFPYPFLNFHNSVSMLIIVAAGILILFLLLMVSFTFYNNIRYKKMHQPVLKDIKQL